MGLSDKFKNMAKQAQDTVAANADKLHDAVENVGVAVNEQTGGKYARHIQKVGDKAGGAIDKVGGGSEQAGGAGTAPEASEPAAASGFEPPSSAPAGTPSGSPGFGSEPAAPAEPAPSAPTAPPASGGFPSFDE